MSLGVALIGSGIFARDEHLPAIQSTPQLVLRAVYSRSLKSAQSLAEGLKDVELYSDDSGPGKSFDDVLGRSDIQCVIVALPINVQPNVIKSALQHGKHVLSEKPIAPHLGAAEELLNWYRSKDSNDPAKATWSVAENYRFHTSLTYSRDVIKSLGRLLGFHVTKFSYVKQGQRYFETSWRKTPLYQGGFLLDGGVHFTAAIRLLLGEDNPIVRVCAQTTQLQEHLPPSDTLDAVLKTKSNVTGTLRISFGTTFHASEISVACEKGSLTMDAKRRVIVRNADGEEDAEKSKDFSDEGFGVEDEVQAWAKAILEGTPDARQTPEEALKDLELLEKMLLSGAADGAPQTISS